MKTPKLTLKTMALAAALGGFGLATQGATPITVWQDDFETSTLGASSATSTYGAVTWNFQGAGVGNPAITITNDALTSSNTQNCAITFDLDSTNLLNFGCVTTFLNATNNTDPNLAHYTLEFDLAVQGITLTNTGAFVGANIGIFGPGSGLYFGQGCMTNIGAAFFPDAGSGYAHYSLPLANFVSANAALLNPTASPLGFFWGAYIAGSTVNTPEELDFVNVHLKLLPQPTPPPVLGIQPAKPGLRMFSSTPSLTYEEEGICSVDEFQSWVNQVQPNHPTYSVTMDWGDTQPGFVFQLDFFPRNYNNQAFNSPYQAYYGTNVVLWTITEQSSTNFVSTMWWKTNGFAQGNYPNQIPICSNAVGNGKWTLTWLNDTDGTVTPPGGTPQPFSLPSGPNDIASFMGDPVTLTYCVTPNTSGNFGKSINIQSIIVTNVAGASQSDDFTKDYGLNASLWDPGFSVNGIGAIQPVPPNGAYWISWGKQDIGYSTNLETAPLITTPAANWYSPGYYANSNAVTTTLESSTKWTLLTTSNLPTANLAIGGPKSATAFFRLSTNAPVQ